MAAATVLRTQFESVLGGHLDWQSRPDPERVPSGVPEIDAATGGIPRGCLTEIFGPASSGRTSLMLSVLAEATARDETCALVDAEDAFDPASAAAAGVRLSRLVWVRCHTQRRARLEGCRPAAPGRRFRLGGHGLGRYLPGNGAAHFAHLVVPPATRGREYPDRAAGGGAAVERQNLRVAAVGMPAGAGGLVGRRPRTSAAQPAGENPIDRSEQDMFACLHGQGNLTALAFEFSPTVELTAPDTVTLDAGGARPAVRPSPGRGGGDGKADLRSGGAGQPGARGQSGRGHLRGARLSRRQHPSAGR